MEGNGLADHLAALLPGLGLLAHHMLVFMSTDGGSRLIRANVGRGLKDTPGSSEPSWYLRSLQVWHSPSAMTSWGLLAFPRAEAASALSACLTPDRAGSWARWPAAASLSGYWMRIRTAISTGSELWRKRADWAGSSSKRTGRTGVTGWTGDSGWAALWAVIRVDGRWVLSLPWA